MRCVKRSGKRQKKHPKTLQKQSKCIKKGYECQGEENEVAIPVRTKVARGEIRISLCQCDGAGDNRFRSACLEDSRA
jgi:hypothetical protein